MSAYKGSELFEELDLIDLSFEQLVESDLHIGSQLSQFERLNFTYIFAKRFDVLIMNLSYGLYNLRLGIYFLGYIVSRRGKVLFFDSLESTRPFVEFIGITSKQYYINRKWIAGLLTNFKNFYPAVFTGISRHFRFDVMSFAGMRYIHRPPNVTCLLNINRGSSAFFENFRLGIPTIALVRSDDRSSGVTFPVFANNSSAFGYFCFFSLLRAAVLNGYRDEIYKFYRKSLRKILRKRYSKMLNRIQLQNSLISYFRQYFFEFFFFSNDIFTLQFFSFISEQMKQSVVLMDYIHAAFSDLFKFFDTQFFLDIDTAAFKMTEVKKLFMNVSFNSKDLFFDSKFFPVLIKVFCFYLFSPDLFKFLCFLFNKFYFLFCFLLDKFLRCCGVKNLFKNFGRNFLVKINLVFFFFRIWCRYNYKESFLLSDYSCHFVHEIFPFFGYNSEKVDYSVESAFMKILFFRFDKHGSFSLLNFVHLNTLESFRRYFNRINSFKALNFSRCYKRFFRIFSKRVKFVRYLNKAIYTKKHDNIFFDVVENKFVTLDDKTGLSKNVKSKMGFSSRYLPYSLTNVLVRRSRLNVLYNTTMVQYFDEEFEDFPFPINNEFFFLHVAYGSFFLAREYVRNKLIQAQKTGFVTVKHRRKLTLKLKKETKLLRCLLFFSCLLFRKKF
jgi:small subunit ribosomal protein S2